MQTLTLLMLIITLAFTGCSEMVNPETELEPEPEIIPPETTVAPITVDCSFFGADWLHLGTFPRNDLSPDRFLVPERFIDPIVSAFAAGKDFVFVISKIGQTRQYQYFIVQPKPPLQPQYNESGDPIPGGRLYGYHFPDPHAHYLQHWAQHEYQDGEYTGFLVKIDLTAMPVNRFGEKDREYLHFPEFGISTDGLLVGFGGAPKIKPDYTLKIYVK